MSESDSATPATMSALVAQFGTDDWKAAYEEAELRVVNANPEETKQLLADIIEGFDHENPDVRKWCVALLDHHATADCIDPLIDMLEDPIAAVRRHAVHSIGCQSCKNDPLDVDVVGLLIDRVDQDPSIRVRRAAAHMIGNQPPEDRAAAFLDRLLRTADDEKLRRNARWALAQPTGRCSSN